MKNSFRLGASTSSHYLGIFKGTEIQVKPAIHDAQRAFPAQGEVPIESGDLNFEIWFPLENGAVPNRHIETANSVLAQIVEMDDAARSIESSFDHDEELAYITIDDSEVRFRYFATTVNTE